MMVSSRIWNSLFNAALWNEFSSGIFFLILMLKFEQLGNSVSELIDEDSEGLREAEERLKVIFNCLNLMIRSTFKSNHKVFSK